MSCKLNQIQSIIDRLIKGKGTAESIGINLDAALQARDKIIYAAQVDKGIIKPKSDINNVAANQMLLESTTGYIEAKAKYDIAKEATDKAFSKVDGFMVKADGSIKLGQKALEATSYYITLLKEEVADLELRRDAASATYTEHMKEGTLDSQRAQYAKDELSTLTKKLSTAKDKLAANKAKHKTAATNVTKKGSAYESAITALEETKEAKKALDRVVNSTRLAFSALSNTPAVPGVSGISLNRYVTAGKVYNILPRIKESLRFGYSKALDLLVLTKSARLDANDSKELMEKTITSITNSLANMEQYRNEKGKVSIPTYDVAKVNGQEGYQNVAQLLMIDDGPDKPRKLPFEVVVAMSAALNDWLYQSATTPKDDDWVNRFLGRTSGAVTAKDREAIGDADTSIDNAANTIGTAIIRELGIKADKDKNVLSQEIVDKLAVELGLIAVQSAVASKQVKFIRKTSDIIYGDNGIKDSNGNYVTLTYVGLSGEFVTEAKTPEFKKQIDGINSTLGVASNVKKPRTDKTDGDKEFTNKSKQGTWLTVAQITQAALNRAENVPWEFNTAYMTDIINSMEETPDALKAHLGWVDPGTVHITRVKGVEGKNRAIEKELEDLIDVYNETKRNGDTEIFFNYFFGKNGRFYIDSNTINPQGYKSQRGAINYSAEEIMTDLEVDAQDLAFAQAFGVDTDKLTIKAALEEWYEIRDSLDTIDFEDHSMVAILDMLNDGTIKGKMAAWHNMMGIANYREYQAYRKKHGTIKGMKARLVIEIDGITNGYILKTLQLPLHKDYEVHLQSGGVFIGERVDKAPEDIGKGEFVKDANGDGGVYFKYKSFGEQQMDESTSDNYAKPAKEMAKIVPEVLKEFKGNDLVARATELAMGAKLYSADDGTLPGITRTYMKEPFMVFNYGAGIKKILDTLVYGSVAKGAMDHFYDLVTANTAEAQDQVTAIIRAASTGMVKIDGEWQSSTNAISETEVEAEIERYLSDTENNLTYVLPQKFEDNLANGVRAGLGQSLERAFESYAPYIEAGDTINRAFQAMFRLFDAKLERKLEEARVALKRDALTEEETDYVIDGMLESMPAIKVALAEAETDKLMIYKESSVSSDISKDTKDSTMLPKGKFKYDQKKAKAQGKSGVLYAKTKRKKLIESFASGSVIPIHFLDGSLMSMVLQNSDALGIHDALMVATGKVRSTAVEYNKAVALLTESYSFTTEVLKSLRDTVNNATDADMAAVDTKYLEEDAEAPYTLRSIYMDMEKIQVKSEQARVGMLSKPIRYEQMAYEGGHYDWNLEGKPYVARTVDRPAKRSVDSNTETASNRSEYKSAVDATKPDIIPDTKGNYTRDPAEIAKELEDSCK